MFDNEDVVVVCCCLLLFVVVCCCLLLFVVVCWLLFRFLLLLLLFVISGRLYNVLCGFCLCLFDSILRSFKKRMVYS